MPNLNDYSFKQWSHKGEPMKIWRVRFRYIADYDYCTPLLHLPIEETIIEGETKESAWHDFINKSIHPDFFRFEEAWEES